MSKVWTYRNSFTTHWLWWKCCVVSWCCVSYRKVPGIYSLTSNKCFHLLFFESRRCQTALLWSVPGIAGYLRASLGINNDDGHVKFMRLSTMSTKFSLVSAFILQFGKCRIAAFIIHFLHGHMARLLRGSRASFVTKFSVCQNLQKFNTLPWDFVPVLCCHHSSRWLTDWLSVQQNPHLSGAAMLFFFSYWINKWNSQHR